MSLSLSLSLPLSLPLPLFLPCQWPKLLGKRTHKIKITLTPIVSKSIHILNVALPKVKGNLSWSFPSQYFTHPVRERERGKKFFFSLDHLYTSCVRVANSSDSFLNHVTCHWLKVIAIVDILFLLHFSPSNLG